MRIILDKTRSVTRFQVFALFNNVAYGVGAYFLYLDWKSHPVDSGVHMQPPI